MSAGPVPTTPDSSQQPPAVPARPTGPARSAYSMGSSSNMVRSLLVILGFVAVLVAVVPRVSSVQQPPVDAASVVSDAVRQSGLAFEAPVGLPTGWRATSARYAASTDGRSTWQGGWTTPKGGFVAIRQTKTASPAWLEAATSNGTQQGTVDMAGRMWTKFYEASHQRTSLVIVPSGDVAPTAVTTVVTATAEEEELRQFTTALQPAQPR